MVATLTFDFWSNLFRPEYDRSLWQVNLRKVLPNVPTGIRRPEVQILVRDINRLRNRIAHHEPIMREDVTARHADILKLVGYRCTVTAGWLKHHSTISTAIRTRPKAGAVAQRAIDRADTRFQIVEEGHRIDAVLAAYRPDMPGIVCVDGRGGTVHLLTAADIVTYVSGKVVEVDGLVAFGDHTVADIITAGGHGWSQVDVGAPASAIADILRDKGVNGIVVTTEVDGIKVPKGVILRAHRRY